MAVRAIGMLKSFDFGNDTDFTLYIRIMSHSGDISESVSYGPISPAVSDVTLNAELRAFIRQYAIDTWNISFQPTDSIRLLYTVDPF